MTLRIERYKNTRHWALYDGQELVVVTVYRRGAREVQRRLAAQPLAGAEAAAQAAAVDAAARKVIEEAGFGPGYRTFTHRVGHGIGMDGHEWTNFVKGNKTRLAPGMCFSDEPMIAIYGEFGIRLEDCLYITDKGPKFFTEQSPAIDKPFA